MEGVVITPNDGLPDDISKRLMDDKMIESYIREVLEDGGEAEFEKALYYIAKAKSRMSPSNNIIGIDVETLYKTLNERAKIQFGTIFQLIKSFGFTLKVVKDDLG